MERAKAALEGVTEGPWTWTHGMDARAMVLGPDNLRVKLEGYRDAEFIASARSLVPELIAEVERLHTWDGLMELLDEHWPADIFPTLPDDDKRDPGPRIISLLRWVSRLRAQETRIRKLAARAAEVRAWSEPDGPTCDEANALNALGEDILAALAEEEA
ncbi:hypothetical protein SEA_TOTO_42 [Mycobacterium phage Toto]|uniref:Uncharacterized protein n=1 Tax=Mycobacterium phage Toto TaxID=1035485 RepID=G1DHX8_9CAUD|nr:hypothetical protein SEA_TOTO_42 [Mycobacterium phage Toto]AEJ92513.1 hypothetical protein SEA_TOTO_42 [Mycobacterium phage Toto]WNO28005.1 hypothetical protein SEA_MARSHMALLOW_42 [Mycobacterium phage Marshmallow]